MIPALEPTDLDRFREWIAQHFGLHFDDARKDQLVEILAQAVGRAGASSSAPYLRRLETRRLPREELLTLVRELTVSETHFFRHPDHFRALAEQVLPELRQARPLRRLSLLSLGCASGEEPYSLAIVLQENTAAFPGPECFVTGIDINPAVLTRAAQGRYTEWSLRGLPDELRRRYFRPDGKQYLLDEATRDRVALAERNLVEDDPAFWSEGAFDIVFCRNVLMYFTPEATRSVIARIARSLVPGGFLFLGPAETLRGVSQDFHLRHTHDTFYYQYRGPGEEVGAAASLPASVPLPAANESWVDAIRHASERIASLGRERPVPAPSPSARSVETAVAPSRTGPDLGAARELVRQERFEDALELLQSPTGEQADDPDTHLLRAMILTNRGEVVRAEQLCRRVLAADELNAEAHYLLALCREHGGELASAVAEDQAAVYLDPLFAMPHLHLGLMHRRAGNLTGARQAFRQARVLLPREDASRVLLFGGGFSRESLLQLCLTELHTCGG